MTNIIVKTQWKIECTRETGIRTICVRFIVNLIWFVWWKKTIEKLEARVNLIWLMTENKANPKARNAIKRKIVGNTKNRTCQTHSSATLIHLTKVTINLRDVIRRRSTRKRTLSNYAQSKRKSCRQQRINWKSSNSKYMRILSSVKFISSLYIITGDDILPV